MVRWLILAIGLAGCTPDVTAPDAGGDEIAVRGSARFYYTVEPDLRMCPSPACGGWWITAVNRRETRCADGSFAARCYVGELDTAGLFDTRDQEAAYQAALSEGRALLRGSLYMTSIVGFDVGGLSVDEAWSGVTGSDPAGRFVRLTDSGMLCLAYPCANIDEDAVNRRAHTMIAEVDWRPSGATPDEIEKALHAMDTPDGVIIAGRRYTVSGAAGTAPARTATELWMLTASR